MTELARSFAVGCPLAEYIIYHLSITVSLARIQDQEKHHFVLKIATVSLRSRLHWATTDSLDGENVPHFRVPV